MNSNPNTPVAGLVERLTKPIIGLNNRAPLEVFDIMADRIRHARIEQLEADKRALVEAREALKAELEHERQQRMHWQARATISNPTFVKGTE